MAREITKIKFGEKNYPKLLAQIPDPPKQLYCRGNLELLNSECVGVVGTRKLTPYGKESAQYITKGLAIAGFTIVSGLAMGIDAIAHQTTLDIGGKTIAVLGGGVSDAKIGPKINLPLARKILENKGLIISEYSDKEEVYAINFAIRDRIISGLSKGVVIVEADKDSGSLITAKCALDQNRDVFAVPGNIFSQKSTGSNELIKSGAKLVMSAHDIIDEYPDHITQNLPILFPTKSELQNRGSSISQSNQNDLGEIGTVQKNILAILQDKGESSTDEITSYLTSVDISDILSSLSVLEINGLIKQLSNGKYRKM
ncbi:MAG: DNA-protecting protein DprA [Candidatus Yanofskybacteria bacterium]|nr:DNA-protecting protein DprA [Candidatus Yanofskybacteria bacterium]